MLLSIDCIDATAGSRPTTTGRSIGGSLSKGISTVICLALLFLSGIPSVDAGNKGYHVPDNQQDESEKNGISFYRTQAYLGEFAYCQDKRFARGFCFSYNGHSKCSDWGWQMYCIKDEFRANSNDHFKTSTQTAGEFLVCEENTVVTGMCASGSNNDCWNADPDARTQMFCGSLKAGVELEEESL